ncbi:AAA family ATPase [Cellulomonas sp. Marseille-Q8402]
MTSPARPLLGRAAELAQVAAVVLGARNGTSGALVVRGEPGIGKTTLLHASTEQAVGCRVVHVAGYEAEQAIAHAALDRLLRPFRDLLDRIPPHHATALRRVSGTEDGPAPDRFLVGLAVLELLAAAGHERPVVCAVDDAHLLDPESLTILAFVARRVYAEPVALLIAARDDDAVDAATAGIPALRLGGLDPESAAALLRASAPVEVDPLIVTRVSAATGGNPLALIDLGADLTVQELTDSGLGEEPVPVGRHLEAHYARLVGATAPATRAWLLVAAADSTGNITLIEAACRALGVATDAAAGAEESGLVVLAPTTRFRHPLVRAASYASATGQQRRAAHAALSGAARAAGLDELEAWHAAKAVLGTDASVAARLERVADLAGARGGVVSRARVLGRAAELTPAGPDRARRLVAAAEAAVAAGAAQLGAALLDQVDEGDLGPVERGRVLTVRVTLGVFTGDPSVLVRATADLLEAAALFHGVDPELEQHALLRAFDWALPAERLRTAVTLAELGERLRAGAAIGEGHASVVLAALAAHVLDPYAEAVPAMRRGLAAIQGLDGAAALPYLIAEVALASALWDVDARRSGLERSAALARDTGSLQLLDTALWMASLAELTGGTPRRAAQFVDEVRELRRAIGYDAEHVTNVAYLAWAGAPRAQVEVIAQGAAAQGFGGVQSSAVAALAVQDLAAGRYADAFDALVQEMADPFLQVTPTRVPDLVEAAVRSGHRDEAVLRTGELAARAEASGSAWARGVALRCRALVAPGPEAEQLFRASVAELDAAGVPVDAARSRLLLGEWLRRARHRTEAQVELRAALTGLVETGASVFADRARAELRATGLDADEPATPTSPGLLTPRERTVARMAARGDTNAEIGATLFISVNTVDYHLRKVFAKLGVTSRRQLRDHVHV